MSSSTSTLAAPTMDLPELSRAHDGDETLPLEQRDDITVDELERLSFPATAELYEGRLVFKIANSIHGEIQSNIILQLGKYLEQNPLGALLTETHFKLWPERNNRARVPDVSFVLKERLPEDRLHYLVMAPDLAVEILSPTDNFLEVMDKVDEYLEQGTKIVWLVIPQKKEVLICTAEGKHSARETLTAPELLPGLEISLKRVFAQIKQ